MLKKQSIRYNHKIFLNGSETKAEKDEVISLSEEWSENEEILFRKLLKQGGSMNIKNNHFRVIIKEKIRTIEDRY